MSFHFLFLYDGVRGIWMMCLCNLDCRTRDVHLAHEPYVCSVAVCVAVCVALCATEFVISIWLMSSMYAVL